MSEIKLGSHNFSGYALVNNVNVYDLRECVMASKYPFSVDTSAVNDDITKTVKKLGSTPIGCGEDNFLNGVRVSFDLTFSNKAWVEAERYHFLDFVSSQSTMHRITQFSVNEQCNEYVDYRVINVLQEKIDTYNNLPVDAPKEDRDYAFLSVVYNIPAGFMLTARMTTNYRQLKTIYTQRRCHRLPEWRAFCEWIETLPMFKEMVLGKDE